MKGEKEPPLTTWYVLLWPGGGTIGARVIDDDRIGELERIVRDEVVVGLPDTRVFVNEGELFGGMRHTGVNDRHFLLEGGVLDPLIQAAALQRIVDFPRAI